MQDLIFRAEFAVMQLENGAIWPRLCVKNLACLPSRVPGISEERVRYSTVSVVVSSSLAS